MGTININKWSLCWDDQQWSKRWFSNTWLYGLARWDCFYIMLVYQSTQLYILRHEISTLCHVNLTDRFVGAQIICRNNWRKFNGVSYFKTLKGLLLFKLAMISSNNKMKPSHITLWLYSTREVNWSLRINRIIRALYWIRNHPINRNSN